MKHEKTALLLSVVAVILALIACGLSVSALAAGDNPPVAPAETVPVVVTEPEETEPETEPETVPETEPEPDPEMVEMLAILIYQEAGGDAVCDECRKRVADVALNRVADPRFPDTLEEVLTAPRQYGELHWTGIRWLPRSQNDCEAHAVQRARDTAREVLMGNHSDLYGNGYIWQAGFHQGEDEVHCCGIYFGR